MCVICGWFRTCGGEEMCLRLLKPVKRRRLLGLSHFAKQHHEDWGISPILPPLVRAAVVVTKKSCCVVLVLYCVDPQFWVRVLPWEFKHEMYPSVPKLRVHTIQNHRLLLQLSCWFRTDWTGWAGWPWDFLALRHVGKMPRRPRPGGSSSPVRGRICAPGRCSPRTLPPALAAGGGRRRGSSRSTSGSFP